MCNEANLLILGYGEGKHNVYCRALSKESKGLGVKKPKLPDDFQGKYFKDRGGEGSCGVHNQHVDFLLIGQW